MPKNSWLFLTERGGENMKKLLAVIICLANLLSLFGVSAFAQEEAVEESAESRLSAIADVELSFIIDESTGEAIITAYHNSPNNRIRDLQLEVTLKKDYTLYEIPVEEWSEHTTEQSATYEYSCFVERGFDYVVEFNYTIRGTIGLRDTINEELRVSYR
jgi:hypothetical protein